MSDRCACGSLHKVIVNLLIYDSIQVLNSSVSPIGIVSILRINALAYFSELHTYNSVSSGFREPVDSRSHQNGASVIIVAPGRLR